MYFFILMVCWISMGINHDNDHPSCADGLHIMSGEWIKGQNLGDVSWSRCSKEDLERFLRYQGHFCCVVNVYTCLLPLPTRDGRAEGALDEESRHLVAIRGPPLSHHVNWDTFLNPFASQFPYVQMTGWARWVLRVKNSYNGEKINLSQYFISSSEYPSGNLLIAPHSGHLLFIPKKPFNKSYSSPFWCSYTRNLFSLMHSFHSPEFSSVPLPAVIIVSV